MPKTSKKTYREQRAAKKAAKECKAIKLQNEENEYKKLPKSFVIRRGKIGKSSKALVQDTRFVMLPLTAINLQERPSNTLSDLKFAAMEMCVSHMLIYSNSASGLHLRIGKLPRGPTCLFKVEEYTLRKDIQKSSGIMYPPNSPEMTTSPLLILNGFNQGGEQLKTLRIVLQQLFPPIQASVAKIKKYRRALLFNYDKETDMVELRHYVIRVRDSKREDIEGNNEDEEKEEKVVLPVNKMGKENIEKQKSYVKLIDIGPRLKLHLLSINSDFMKGKCLYRLYDYDDDEAWMKENTEKVKQADQQRSENIQKLKEEQKKKKEQRMKMEKEEDDDEDDADDQFYFDEELEKMEEED
ncbi:hypothetical protein, conserved [Entamoeba dispar SAW760]|uniref:Brix domain-containing protein n=1 Tax=Entamoeba dispar (strain ATCC PRA-260 / SAW760) TaxID=370354 RepID=B0E852_ENTDS|nr:uncharacterized protein EDI_213750 [Entamoeba dispar SAW760]EDR29300.1 hypothetical protein, conserved [Entamoeba dispar SAW760]|eukprot:EDR29300.1 hypothetical protein, conserved [Entamoeba dispar SAW760]